MPWAAMVFWVVRILPVHGASHVMPALFHIFVEPSVSVRRIAEKDRERKITLEDFNIVELCTSLCTMAYDDTCIIPA
ncbi:unnamed protein product [Urochloa humidicola]